MTPGKLIDEFRKLIDEAREFGVEVRDISDVSILSRRFRRAQ
jgi:hypothetical protein